jgi:hypothetical protein
MYYPAIGDRVRYNAKHLKACGIYTGEICFIIGTIMQIGPEIITGQVVRVLWDNGEESSVSSGVLIRKGTPDYSAM